MMLSIDVLPAPLGPMMARISPLRMSNETSVTALMPPKESDTLSTASSTSPATTSPPVGALMRPLRGARTPQQGQHETAGSSCRPLQDAGARVGLDLAGPGPSGHE